MPVETIGRVSGQRFGDFVPGEEVLPARLAEVTNDGCVEALVSFALPQRVGGLHEQVFERERRVIGSEAVRAGEPRRGGVEAGVEQERFSHRFVRSTRLRKFGGNTRFPDVMGRGAEPNELAVDTKMRAAERAKQPKGDLVHEREVSDESSGSALCFEQLEHAWWK